MFHRFFFLLLACSHEVTPDIKEAVPAPLLDDEKQPVTTGLCANIQETKCPNDQQPTRCIATGYDTILFPPDFSLVAWGKNPCLAKVSLLSKACDKGKKPEKLRSLDCSPDPSRGECPFEQLNCESGAGEMIFCRAARYRDAELSVGQSLVGRGASECEAKNKLMANACRLGLRPSALGQITCVKDQSNGQCPPAHEMCGDTVNPNRCTASVTSGDEVKEIALTAVNRCLGNYLLKEAICKFNLPPEQVKAVSCQDLKKAQNNIPWSFQFER